MKTEALVAYVKALSIIYERSDRLVGHVYVTYRGNNHSYQEWAPSSRSITENGLLDPGFGSGPYYYSDYDRVEVRLDEWVAAYGDSGRRDFADLLEMLHGVPDLDVAPHHVMWERVKGGASTDVDA